MNDFIEAANKAFLNNKKIDETTTIDLINDRKLMGNIKKLLNKCNDNNGIDNFSEEELSIISNYICELEGIIKQSTMCKVIPMKQVKKLIHLELDLKGFFTRKADFMALLYGKNDCVGALYSGLRLDYSKSEFEVDDDFYVVISVELPRFSIRVPTKTTPNLDSIKSRYINIDNGWPYTGIGFISNEFLTPEFYISIDQNGNKSEPFPIRAFTANLYLAKKGEKELIHFAVFDCGDNECAADEKFVIDPKQLDFARKNGWVEG